MTGCSIADIGIIRERQVSTPVGKLRAELVCAEKDVAFFSDGVMGRFRVKLLRPVSVLGNREGPAIRAISAELSAGP